MTLSPMTVISMQGKSKSTTETVLRWTWRVSIVLLLFAVCALAWLVFMNRPYKPGSDFGYNLGLIGGLLMLSLLVYPLRKRVRWLERMGSMTAWFRYHIFAGITGPLLILFHSTFHVGSMNGAAALYSMLLVALSGVIGRFIYRHVHRGLYGRRQTLAEAEADIRLSLDHLESVFALKPDVEPRLQAFHAYAFERLDSLPRRVWRFVTLRARSRRLANEIRLDAKRMLKVLGRDRKMTRAERIVNYRLAREQVGNYLDAVVRAAQIASWERLFSLWHVVHIPFLYLLVLSGILHVVAVHMY